MDGALNIKSLKAQAEGAAQDRADAWALEYWTACKTQDDMPRGWPESVEDAPEFLWSSFVDDFNLAGSTDAEIEAILAAMRGPFLAECARLVNDYAYDINQEFR